MYAIKMNEICMLSSIINKSIKNPLSFIRNAYKNNYMQIWKNLNQNFETLKYH